METIEAKQMIVIKTKVYFNRQPNRKFLNLTTGSISSGVQHIRVQIEKRESSK
jgi:hypothetical protein